MGHQHERSRGDSRILDYPDVIWTLVRENENPASRRFFKAFGRGIEHPEAEIQFNSQTCRMAIGTSSRKDVAAVNALPDIVALLTTGGPLSKNAIETGPIRNSHSRDAIRKALKHGCDQNVLDVAHKPGKGGGWVYSVNIP
jgi:hypothetical protein